MEGTDGSGTTTQGDLLAAWLRDRGLEVVRTAQPSPLEGGQLVRRVLRGELDGVDAATVALLFAADRVDAGRRLVTPALQRGAWVVCDRHLASSLAFQVVDGDGGIDPQWLMAINRYAMAADVTLWLDLPVADAMARILARGKPIERFETAATLQRVRDRYAEVFAAPPAQLGRVVRVDARGSRDEVAAAIQRAIGPLLHEGEP
jgi:dTMP kinase